jgi:hypothetical protein
MNKRDRALLTWWVSWCEKSPDYRPVGYPPNEAILGWWCSGEAGDGSYWTLCAWVRAPTLAKVGAAVRRDWPGRKTWRFQTPAEPGWRPTNRFRVEGWMIERVEALTAEEED